MLSQYFARFGSCRVPAPIAGMRYTLTDIETPLWEQVAAHDGLHDAAARRANRVAEADGGAGGDIGDEHPTRAVVDARADRVGGHGPDKGHRRGPGRRR